jgi:hypothetical protein
MSDFMHGLRTSGIVWALTGGILVGVLTVDAVPLMFSIAIGAAAGVVYIRRAPIEADIKAQVLVMSAQIGRIEDMLADETAAHDRTREKLRICKAAMADAGLRIIHLEAEADGLTDKNA